MLTFKQLFHSMPYEIKEKILSFTYKQQPKDLLEEIREFYKAKEYLLELTIIIDNCNSKHELIETVDNIHDRLWSGLYFIKNLSYKVTLIKNWKYKDTLEHTEEEHKNGLKVFKLLDWEKSFSVYFWMYIYH